MIQDSPLVCIMMPVFNAELTLELAINSLKAQTYSNWICIIVNDGSTDKTKSILENINDTRFRVIHLDKNKGRGNARQVCMDNSVGEYITFLDSDDFYHPEKIQVQVNAFRNNINIALVCCGVLTFSSEYNVRSTRGGKYAGQIIEYNQFDSLLFFSPSVMIKRSKAITLKYNPILNAAEDIDYFGRYLFGEKYFVIGNVYYYYREDESIPIKKFISYYSYTLLYYLISLSSPSVMLLQKILVATFKLILITLLAPLIGTNYFLSKRGTHASDDEVLRFKIALKHIS
jgi:glycosyltransferase involved in cell wall biosynthesis